MASVHLCAFMKVFLLIPVALAVPWSGATPTPAAGLIAMNGVSPRPTVAPGAGGIPRELLKRDDQYIFPPPTNWCGFESSVYTSSISCRINTYTCSFKGNHAGCCDPNEPCTFITGCDDATTACTDCATDILYCSQTSSFCGSYVFKGSSVNTLYFCTASPAYSLLEFVTSIEVERLNDFYATAVGSTIDEVDSSPTSSSIAGSPTASPTGAGTFTTSTPVTSQSTTASPHKGLAVGAIAGIAVGAACIALAIVVALIVFCCVKRRRTRAAVAQTQSRPQATFGNDPPMQQTTTNQAYPNTAPIVQYPSSTGQTSTNQAYPNTAPIVQYPSSTASAINKPPQYPGSPQSSAYASTYNGQASPINSPLLAHDPTNRMSNISPPPLPYNHSNTTVFSPLSPNPSILGDVTNTPAFPKPASSPVDAGGMRAFMGHAAANGKDQLHEVSAELMGQDQTQGQGQGQSQDAFHEVSTQSEPRYAAYTPTLSNQHESSFTTYTQSSVVQELSDTQSSTINIQTSTQDPFSGQRSSPAPWDLSEERGAH